MGTFVTGNTALPTPKQDAFPATGSATELDAADINNLWNAADDLRTAVFNLQAVPPVSVGVDALGNVLSTAIVLTPTSGAAMTIRGSMPDGASSVGAVLDTLASLANAGAKLASIRNGGVEKAFFSAAGALSLSGSLTQLSANTSLGLLGNRSAADTGADVVLNGQAIRTNGKIASFQNNAVEKASFDFSGNLSVGGTVSALPATTTLVVKGNAAATGAVGVALDNATTQTTGKIASFRTGGAEVASVDFGGAWAGSTAALTGLITASQFKALAASSATLIGQAASTGAVGNILDNATTQTTGTILSLRTGGAEKASFDFAGNLNVGGALVVLPATTSLTLKGNAASTGAVATILDNVTTQTTGTITSFRTNGSEKANLDFAGQFNFGGTIAALPATTTLVAKGNAASTAAVGVALDNVTTQTTGKIVSVRTGGAEKAYFDFAGTVNAPGLTAFGTASQQVQGTIADGSSAIGVKVGNSTSLANATAKIASFYSDALTTEKFAINANGKFVFPTGGGAAVVGKSVLVGGTVTVSTTAVVAGSIIILTNNLTGGTVGTLSVGTITAGTSFVINSSSGTDTSTVGWMVMN